MTKLASLLLALAVLPLLVACGGSDATFVDAAADTSDATDAVTPDAATPDAEADGTKPDASGDAVTADTEPADATPDEVAPDAADATPDVPVPTDSRACNVFPSDPTTDNWTTSVTYAPHLDDQAGGHLTGQFSTVYNCLPQSSGSGGMGGYELCTPTQTVAPGDDGTYLHVVPPQDEGAFDDPFAEVQMYVHMNEIHDYFSGTHGVTALDWPLIGLVNLSVYQYNQWTPFDNAAFMPAETMSAMGLDFGLDQDAIVFGQGTFVDFSYDATVIYHEYTHAVIGEQRLYGYTADVFGLNPEPMAMNEGSADYFAASRVGRSRIGAYALDMPMMGDLSRDLSEFHKCPDDLVGESHSDGRMWASALWAIRVALGAEVADRIIFTALMGAGMNTTFHEASDLLLQAAADEDVAAGTGTAAHDAVQAALAEHGVDACQRVKPFVDLTSVSYTEPLLVRGVWTSMVDVFQSSKLVPMAFQYVAVVPDGTAAARLEFKARVSDEMSQYYQGQVKPKVAFRSGQPVAYSYSGGKMQMTADALLAPTASGSGWNVKYSLTLAGDCLKSGELYLQFMNATEVDIQLDSMSLTWLDDATGLTANFAGCQ